MSTPTVSKQLCTAPTERLHPKRVEPCGAPAFYIWTPRKRPSHHQPMCRECGEAIAGNYTDELTKIP